MYWSRLDAGLLFSDKPFWIIFLRMERRRSQKSQMRANVSEQSVVLDSGARVPESEVKIGYFKLENEKQKRIYIKFKWSSILLLSRFIFQVDAGLMGALMSTAADMGKLFTIYCNSFFLEFLFCIFFFSCLTLQLYLFNFVSNDIFIYKIFFLIKFWRDGHIAKKQGEEEIDQAQVRKTKTKTRKTL